MASSSVPLTQTFCCPACFLPSPQRKAPRISPAPPCSGPLGCFPVLQQENVPGAAGQLPNRPLRSQNDRLCTQKRLLQGLTAVATCGSTRGATSFSSCWSGPSVSPALLLSRPPEAAHPPARPPHRGCPRVLWECSGSQRRRGRGKLEACQAPQGGPPPLPQALPLPPPPQVGLPSSRDTEHHVERLLQGASGTVSATLLCTTPTSTDRQRGEPAGSGWHGEEVSAALVGLGVLVPAAGGGKEGTRPELPPPVPLPESFSPGVSRQVGALLNGHQQTV